MPPRRRMTVTLVRTARPDGLGMLIRIYWCGACHTPWRRTPEEGDVCPVCGLAPGPGVVA